MFLFKNSHVGSKLKKNLFEAFLNFQLTDEIMCYECSDTQDCLDPFNSINNANYLKACAYGQTCQVSYLYLIS